MFQLRGHLDLKNDYQAPTRGPSPGVEPKPKCHRHDTPVMSGPDLVYSGEPPPPHSGPRGERGWLRLVGSGVASTTPPLTPGALGGSEVRLVSYYWVRGPSAEGQSVRCSGHGPSAPWWRDRVQSPKSMLFGRQLHPLVLLVHFERW